MALPSQNATRIKRFDGSNYLAWRNRVYTELLCDELTELVEKKPTEEMKKKSFGSEKKPLTWTQADARARRIIVENLDDSILHYAPTDVSSFEVWRRLKSTYCRTSYLQHAYLRRRLSNLQYDGRGEIALFFREFDDIIAEIRSGGGKVGRVDDVEAVVTLLAALPSDYSPVIASLGDINENSLVTLEAVKGSLLDYDLKRKDERKGKKLEPESPGAAFYADSPRDARSDQKGERIRCSYCNRDGHRESRCFKKRNERKSNGDARPSSEANIAADAGEPRVVAFIAENEISELTGSAVVQGCTELEFVADSGCTKFMINQLQYFSSYSVLDHPVHITLANNTHTQATHTGTVEVVSNVGKRLSFGEVLFVPELRRNLLSIRRISSKGFEVTFKGESVEVVGEGVVLATGFAREDLYYFSFLVHGVESNMSEVNGSYELIHRRLGHPCSASVQTLKMQGLVCPKGTPKLPCEACIKGKQTQLPYPSSSFKTTRPLEQVVSDVCFAERPSISGHSYFVTFLDVHTHFAVVYLLKKKNEVFSKLVEYEAMVSAHFKSRICSFLCDNGKEFMNSEVVEFCKCKGIRILNSVAYNHQQNGRAERLNRSLEDRARTMLIDSGMPKIFWAEAILCATFLLNRCPTQATGKIPALEWYGNDVNYSKLRAFGCVCFIHVPAEKRLKFDARSIKGIMVGYAPMAYRVYNLETRQVQVARNVIFNEGAFYRDLFPSPTPSRRVGTAESSSSEDEPADTTIPPPTPGDVAPDSPLPSVRRSSREKHPPTRLDDYEVTIGFCEALLVENSRDPKWEAPKAAEMESMRQFGVWKLVNRTPQMKVLRSKWALQEKPNKLKARLVAVGCDEKDVPTLLFSPVVNMTTVKILLSVVVQNGYLMHQMDVSNAFLHGDIDYDVYMEQAPGFCSDRTKVCKLQKAIYGLKISPRIWNRCIDEYLVTDLGFVRSTHDFCFYFLQLKNCRLFLLVYVDDLLIASDSLEMISSFKTKISSRFNVVDLGESKRFLGMIIDYNITSQVMTLSQADFIMKIAKKFNVECSKPVYTPIEVDLQLDKAEENKVNVPFRQLVGCLLYVSIITRPDVAFAVHYFSRFMNSFSMEHFNYLKRVVAYLVYTKDKNLTYTASAVDSVLECFVDADWGADRLDRRSVSGCAARLYGNVISWTSKKQSSVALSSTESEYISLSSFVHDTLVWLVEILKEFQVVVEHPVRIFEDNQAVICLSENPITSKRSKHIDVRFRFVKEMVLTKQIKLQYLPTSSQMADGFTKALVKSKFVAFRDMLRVV